MEGYYSSDEDVAWGPLTLREIKKALSEKSRKVTRRQTDFAQSKFSSPSTTMSEETTTSDSENKTDNSTSTYYTAKSTLETAEASNNHSFLEKLTKVIDGENGNDVAPNNQDTLIDIIKSPENEGVENIDSVQHNLSCNTIEVQDEDENCEDGNDKVIVISSDESAPESASGCESDSDSDILSVELPYFDFAAAKMKHERTSGSHRVNKNCSTDEIIEISSSDSVSVELLLNTENKGTASVDEKSDMESFDLQLSYEENNETEDFLMEKENSLMVTEKQEDTMSAKTSVHSAQDAKENKEMKIDENCDSDDENISKMSVDTASDLSDENDSDGEKMSDVNIDKSPEQCNENNSDAETNSKMSIDEAPEQDENIENCDPSLNEPDNTVDNIESNDSEIFNDTLEEMEMALKQGLDYVMPGDGFPISRTPEISIHQIEDAPKPSGNQKLKMTRENKYDYIRSPVGDYIKKKVPPEIFKLPSKPVKSKVAPRSPLVNVNQFKNIASPIGVYINSPRVCCKQNILAKNVSALKSPVTGDVVKEKKQDFSIPEVVYKPAKKVVTTSTSKDIELPSSIKKMIKEPIITTHESRVNANANQSAVARQLLKEDISVDSSLFDQSEDVSFVNVKQVFPSTK